MINNRSYVKFVEDSSYFEDNKYFRHWISYVCSHGNTLTSLLYRHYLFKNICECPVVNEDSNLGLSSIMKFMTWNRNEYFPLYDIEVWSKTNDDDFTVNKIRKLRPEIKNTGIQLANRLDISDHQLSRDHASLSSHVLIYGLYLICVVLEYKMRIENKNSSLILLTNIAQTLTDLKGVLFHVSY